MLVGGGALLLVGTCVLAQSKVLQNLEGVAGGGSSSIIKPATLLRVSLSKHTHTHERRCQIENMMVCMSVVSEVTDHLQGDYNELRR